MESKKKIYLATPDAGLSRLIRGALESSGHRIQEAMDWSLIVEEVGIFGADVVILDQTIPGADCIALIEQLKQDPRTEDNPVFVVLGKGKEEQAGAFLDAGADDLLFQPLVAPVVVNRIKIHAQAVPRSIDLPDLMNLTDTVAPSDEEDVTDPGRKIAERYGSGLPEGIDGHYVSDLGVLIEVSEAMASSLSSTDALYVLVRRISQAIPVNRCNVLIAGVKREEAFVVASHDNADLRRHQVDLGRYPEVRRCMAAGEVVLIEDVRKDPEMEQVMDLITAIDLRSALVLPLFVREAVVGTLSLTTRRASHGFTRREILFLRTMANMAAGLLSVSPLLDEVRREAAAEKPPMEEFAEVVLDLDDQIEGLIEELESK